MQRCQNPKLLMESNGVGTYLDGWGMSIATQQAKEHQNQTPGAKVMAEMVFVGGLILGGEGARGSEVRAPGVVSGVGRNLPVGSGCLGFEVRVPGGHGFGRKFVGKWKKLVDFMEGKVEMDEGKARST